MKIGYFADGPWAHRAIEKIVSDDRFQIKFIVPRYDNRDPILAEWAKRLCIDFLPLENINAVDSLQMLKFYDADIFVSMSFNQILKKPIIEMPRLGFINCHAGALPFYRGRNILNWALINDAKEFGVTVHYIDEGIDTGDIILQKTAPISDTDNYSTLLDRATILCADVLYEALVRMSAGTADRILQSAIAPVGFYCGRRVPGDELIDWNWSSRRIFNFVRAISPPGPCARTFLGKTEILVRESAFIPGAPSYIGTPGEVVGRGAGGVIVKTGDSTILLNDVICPEALKLRIGMRFAAGDESPTLSDLHRRLQELEHLNAHDRKLR